jgi:hypothetical protein
MRTPLVNESQPQDIKALEAALDEAERDARTLVSGVGEEIGGAWRRRWLLERSRMSRSSRNREPRVSTCDAACG